MTKNFEVVRPFNMSRAVERKTNGLWTIELFYFNTGDNELLPQIVFECEHGNLWGRTMWASWNGSHIEAREDYYLVPKYVREYAARMCVEVFNN